MAFQHQQNKQPSKTDICAITKVISKHLNGLCKVGEAFRVTDQTDSTGNTKDIYTANKEMIVIKDNLFAFEKTLGAGAFGSVFAATNLITGEKVAIKKQKPQCCPDPMIQMQVKVTCCHGIGLCKPEVNTSPEYKSDGFAYFVLPLADSVYYKWVQKTFAHHPINGWKTVIKALINIVDDLDRLHKDKKVHMDLKGDNVLIIDDKAYLSDFGKTEDVGKLLPKIPCKYEDYPHNAPEYKTGVRPVLCFPGPQNGFGQPGPQNFAGFGQAAIPQYYCCHEAFDAWSLGEMISRDVAMFPLEIQVELKTMVRGLMNVCPEKRPPMKAVRSYLNKILRKNCCH